MTNRLWSLSPITRRNLWLETISCISQGVVNGLVLMAQVVAIGSLHDSGIAAAVMVAAMPASALLQPIWASWSRRMRLQSMAVWSGALRCLPLLLAGWIDQAWVFALLILLYYVLAGPQQLAVNSLYKYTYPDAARGRIIGWFRLVQHCLAVPVIIGSACWFDSEPSAYQLIFPLGALVGILGTFFYSHLHIPSDQPANRALKMAPVSLRQIRVIIETDVAFRLFQTTIFLTGAGFLMSRSVLLQMLRDVFHLTQLEMSMLVMVFPLVLGGMTAPAWGWLVDQTSPVAGRIAFAWLGLFAYLAFFTSFFEGWLSFLYLGAILRGLVLGAAEVATTTGNLYYAEEPERAALYESISSVFQGIRGLSMPMLGWLIFQYIAASLAAYIFMVATVLNGWSLLVAIRLWRMDKTASKAKLSNDQQNYKRDLAP